MYISCILPSHYTNKTELVTVGKTSCELTSLFINIDFRLLQYSSKKRVVHR